MKGRCEVRLWLPTYWPEALSGSLEPDNASSPPGVRVSCRAAEGLVECTVSVECGEPRGILRLRNTVDDLLSSAKAALESLEASREAEA